MLDKDLNGKIPPPSDEGANEFLENRLAGFPELSLDRLKEGPVPAPGSSDIVFDDLVFNTPSGKIELCSDEAEKRWGVHKTPEYTPPSLSEKSDFPFVLLSSNTKNRIHSQFGNLKIIGQFDDPSFIYINPSDALEKGIPDSSSVEVFNSRGVIRGKAKFDFGLRSGCVLIKNGRWMDEGGSVNLLTEQVETDMGYGAAFSENRVDIRRAN